MALGCGAPTLVPDILDTPDAAATTALTGAGLVPGVKTTAYHATIAAGHVIRLDAGRG